jgi:phosphoglycolate phosphatase-like HAD superfamily hydrolase
MKNKKQNLKRKPRLLLFDIDGTLLSARGIPKTVMHKVLSERYDGLRYDNNYNFSGRTDPEIIEHLLEFSDIKFRSEDIDNILLRFAYLLEEEFKNNHQPYLLSGVKELIINLAEIEWVYLGLVTGNTHEGARIKLENVGMLKYFPIGGFGDDSKHRSDLPPLAQMRAEKYYDKKFSKEQVWIIGDSIFDIKCAEMNDLRCLAVSSGVTPTEDLAAANPEYLEDDLSDTKSILKILLES